MGKVVTLRRYSPEERERAVARAKEIGSLAAGKELGLVPADRYFGRADEVMAAVEAGYPASGIGEPLPPGDPTAAAGLFLNIGVQGLQLPIVFGSGGNQLVGGTLSAVPCGTGSG